MGLSSQDRRARKAINGHLLCPQPLAGIVELGFNHGTMSEIAPVNAPSRVDSIPQLEDFPFRVTDNVRFADLDPNHHVNNAVYASYFETGRVTLMKDRSYGLMPQGLAWVLIRLDMHFRAELRWPGSIEMGLGLVKFGRTSVTFDQVVFSEGKCIASAQTTSVLIDETSHKSTPLTADIVRNFQPWLRRGVEIVQPVL
jgi:acyl-CoA thioester hydrolase